MGTRYTDAAHAMQSGVAMIMNREPNETSPKHLRVGINSAMVNDAAVVRLLIAKGIFTAEEYEAAVTAEMEEEVKRYEHRIDPSGRVKLA